MSPGSERPGVGVGSEGGLSQIRVWTPKHGKRGVVSI